jgi:predicted ATPase/DNA-binding CsgD family transcriptional regulator
MSHAKVELPVQSTVFIGRKNEVEEIVSLLDDEYCRLLTLVGPGGMGKTRLAQRVAETLIQPDADPARTPFSDGVVFVPLQSVSSPDQVASTIANTLDWETYQGNDPEAETLAYLRDKRFLLILDNFEHLLDAGPFIQKMLDVAPEVKLIVTSRAVLNLAEEWLFQVDGMSLPADKGEDGTADSDAVRLFSERAQRVRHDFSLDSECAQAVRICRLVEGMPLAIELAAAWLRRLSCADIVNEIEHGLDILASDQIGILERHRTMRVVFDHSWRLLGHDEQAVLMALSVFRGGFLREAAQEAAGATLPILASLVDMSLLTVTPSGRYAIHELQRQYAAERLAEAPDLFGKVRDEHARYYLKFVARPALQFLAPGNRALLAQIVADIDNILAAWYWSVDRGRLSDLRRATETLYWFSWLSTYHLDIERAFAYAAGVLRNRQVSDEEQRTVYAYVLATHGSMLVWLGRNQDAGAELRESVAMLRELPGARRELGFALGALGWSLFSASYVSEATPLFHEAAALDEETGQPEQQAWVYCMLAVSAGRQNAFDEQEQWCQKALNLGRAIHDQRTIAHSLHGLGLLAIQRGKYASARHHLEDCLFTARSHDIPTFVNKALIGLGTLDEAIGELDEASHYLQQSLEIARLDGKEPAIAESLVALAHVRTAQREVEAAANLYQEAAEILVDVEFPQDRIQLLAGMAALALTTEDHARAASLYEECLSLSRQSEYRLEDAQALVGLGLSALRQADTRRARFHLLEALEQSLSAGLAPAILDSVAAVAELHAAEGDLNYAAQLAALVGSHPATKAQTKQRANLLLAQFIPALSPDARGRLQDGGPAVEVEAVAKRLVAELTRLSEAPVSGPQPLIEPLSDRELQVLRMVAAGKSNREIGRELYLALGTVKSHLHHIFQKLDVQSRTQAVTRAIDLNLM